MKTVIAFLVALCVAACSDDKNINNDHSSNSSVKQSYLLPIQQTAKKPYKDEDFVAIKPNQDKK